MIRLFVRLKAKPRVTNTHVVVLFVSRSTSSSWYYYHYFNISCTFGEITIISVHIFSLKTRKNILEFFRKFFYMSVCDVFRVSIVYWLGGGRDSCNRRYLTLLASTKNRVPAGKSIKDPKTPRAYDQERSLCSQFGIQSLLSPFTPKINTAIRPDKPKKNIKK